MTYYELLRKYRLEAQKTGKEKEAIDFLVLNSLNLSKAELILKYSESVENEGSLINLFQDYLYNNIPVQYIIGHTYFYGLKFKVNKHVLIPRFDSEILIECIFKNLDLNKNYTILDIGTGSGALSIVIKKYFPNTIIDAIDISSKAIELAKENSKINNVDINFYESDIFSNINKKYDIVISNPPYISVDEELSPEVKQEPHIALYANNNGLYFYEEILKNINKYLNKNFYVFLEIGYTQANEIKKIIKKRLGIDAEVVKDLQGLDRVIIIKEE